MFGNVPPEFRGEVLPLGWPVSVKAVLASAGRRRGPDGAGRLVRGGRGALSGAERDFAAPAARPARDDGAIKLERVLHVAGLGVLDQPVGVEPRVTHPSGTPTRVWFSPSRQAGRYASGGRLEDATSP